MKKKGVHTKIIMLSVILFMSVLGISYASWNDSIDAGVGVNTGTSGLIIHGYSEVEPEEGINIRNLEIEGNTASITAEMNQGYQGLLTLLVQNTGSVPVKILDHTISPGDEPIEIDVSIYDGFKELQLDYILFNNSDSWRKSLYITLEQLEPQISTPDAITLDEEETNITTPEVIVLGEE